MEEDTKERQKSTESIWFHYWLIKKYQNRNPNKQQTTTKQGERKKRKKTKENKKQNKTNFSSQNNLKKSIQSITFKDNNTFQ